MVDEDGLEEDTAATPKSSKARLASAVNDLDEVGTDSKRKKKKKKKKKSSKKTTPAAAAAAE